jgi:DNA repair protein RadC
LSNANTLYTFFDIHLQYFAGDDLEERKPTHRIADIEVSERPRERLAKLGPEALTTAELLAVLLDRGVAGENAVQVGQHMLGLFGGVIGLQRAALEELQTVRGVGLVKATRIKASFELGRRLALAIPEERPTIHSPADAAALVQYEMSGLNQEHLRTMLLNTRNQVLDIKTLYQGSLNSSLVRVGEVFKPAIVKNAASIIAVHNHPSGSPEPSPEDISLTRALVQAGKLLDVDVIDHIIIGQGRFVSLKERGLGFN